MSASVTNVGPQYAKARLGRLHEPERDRPYAEYRPCLREEFFFTCVYCLSTEREVASTTAYGSFEIEHFRPKGKKRFRWLRNNYRNLLWACGTCNLAKGDRWPSSADEKSGFRFIDPTVEPLGEHLEIVGERVVAVGKDPSAGEFMIDEINLNSREHVNRRRERADLAKKLALLEGLFAVLQTTIETISEPGERQTVQDQATAVERELSEILGLIDRSKRPWDAPTACRC